MRFHKANNTDVKTIYEKRLACIDHLLNDHTNCTDECPARKVGNESYVPKVAFLDPKMHSDIRDDLEQVVSFYTRKSRIAECIHDGFLDRGTQYNEATNNATITMAPKTRNYATSFSFSDRVHTMIGVHNFGHVRFNTVVFSLLGQKLPTTLYEYLTIRQQEKTKRRQYKQQPQVKKSRKTGYAAKYVKETTMIQGFYESNAGLNLENTIETQNAKEFYQKTIRYHSKTLCKSKCGLYGHYNKTSFL